MIYLSVSLSRGWGKSAGHSRRSSAARRFGAHRVVGGALVFSTQAIHRETYTARKTGSLSGAGGSVSASVTLFNVNDNGSRGSQVEVCSRGSYHHDSSRE